MKLQTDNIAQPDKNQGKQPESEFEPLLNHRDRHDFQVTLLKTMVGPTKNDELGMQWIEQHAANFATIIDDPERGSELRHLVRTNRSAALAKATELLREFLH